MSEGWRRAIRATIQVVGFLASLAALGWCVHVALQPANREQLGRLWDAPASSLSLMVGLTVASLLLNGLIFWVTLLPVRRLPGADVVAVNALATFLAYLPFKLSAVARMVIHNRRDGLPVPLIGAWFAAVGAILLLSLLPPALVSLWRGQIDLVWGLATAGGIVLGAGAVLGVSRVLRGERGLARVQSLMERIRLRPALRLMQTSAWRNLHEGFSILAAPGIVFATVVLRLADAGVQAARFVVAATILGQTLPAEQAVIIAVSFFLIGIVSPTGMLGFREAGAAGLAGALAFATSAEFAAVALLVGAAEAVTNLGGAAIGLAWLRPDRLLRPTAAVSL